MLDERTIAEQPDILVAVLSQDYLSGLADSAIPKIVNKIISAFTYCVKNKSENASKIACLTMSLSLRSYANINKHMMVLHEEFARQLGSAEYLRLYNEVEGHLVMPSFFALETLDDFNYLKSFSHYFDLVGTAREKDITLFGQQTNIDEDVKDLVTSSMSKYPVEVALKLIKKAKKDSSLVPLVSNKVSSYLKLIAIHHKPNFPDFDINLLLSKELLFEFVKLGHTINYAEKTIYLDSSSLIRVAELHSSGDEKIKSLVNSFIKDLISKNRRNDLETDDFIFKMLPDHLAKFVHFVFTTFRGKNDQIKGTMVAYFTAVGGDIINLAYCLEKGKVSPHAIPVVYDCLAKYILENNDPNKIESALKKLKENLDTKTQTPLGSLIENVILPTLNQSYDKAWKAVSGSFIYPAQKEIITNLMVDMLQKNYDSYHLKPNGEVHKNPRLVDM